MSAELVLFIIVAAVAIFSAAFMLVSRNAVHSALFLVINFLCVAFFYLMLNASFLGMIQVTVYAGAIMVLFMFVIMLLGAEKLGGAPARYPWLALAATILTTIFLLVASVSIGASKIGLLKPVPPAPQARFVHAAAGAPALDLYLDTDRIAKDLAFNEPTGFARVKAGEHTLLAFAACTDEDPTRCPDPIKAGSAPLLALPVKLEPEKATTFVVAGTSETLQVLTVPTDLSPLEDENSFRLTAVNALPESGPVNLLQLDPVHPDALQPNPDDPNQIKIRIVAPALAFGDIAPMKTLPRGEYMLAWVRGDEKLQTLREFDGRAKSHELLILTSEQTVSGTRNTSLHVEPAARTDEVFGSPQNVGMALLTNYLLPFQLVALLLLVAMVGAIVLTRDEAPRRVRQRLVVSPLVRRINRAAAANTAANQTTNQSAESSTD
jgi:NADH:ubiquinone oxidoreductase subunit 6 (subunit J)